MTVITDTFKIIMLDFGTGLRAQGPDTSQVGPRPVNAAKPKRGDVVGWTKVTPYTPGETEAEFKVSVY